MNYMRNVPMEVPLQLNPGSIADIDEQLATHGNKPTDADIIAEVIDALHLYGTDFHCGLKFHDARNKVKNLISSESIFETSFGIIHRANKNISTLESSNFAQFKI